MRRLTPGTVTFQMRLYQPIWSYDNGPVGRLVDVEVEIGALQRLSYAHSIERSVTPSLVGTRKMVEWAAKLIIDREGPNFIQPVRVTAEDLRM